MKKLLFLLILFLATSGQAQAQVFGNNGLGASVPTWLPMLKVGAGTCTLATGADTICVNGYGEFNAQVNFDGAAYLNQGAAVATGYTVTFTAATGKNALMLGYNGDLVIAGAADHRVITVLDSTVATQDADHAAQTNPTLFIHSVLGPDVSNNEWGSLFHDGSNFNLGLGANVGTGSGPVTANNGFLVTQAAITAAAAGGYALRINATLNDTASAGGESHSGLWYNVTETDKTGVPTVNLLRLSVGAVASEVDKFVVNDAGVITSGQVNNGTALPGTCITGSWFLDTDSNDCINTGSGDGALCICKTTNTWALVKDL